MLHIRIEGSVCGMALLIGPLWGLSACSDDGATGRTPGDAGSEASAALDDARAAGSEASAALDDAQAVRRPDAEPPTQSDGMTPVTCGFPAPLGNDASCPGTPIDGVYLTPTGKQAAIECWTWPDPEAGNWYQISEIGSDFVIAQNSEQSEDHPCRWSRLQWVWGSGFDGDGGSPGDGGAAEAGLPEGGDQPSRTLYICITENDADSRAAARASSADPMDLETGCNGGAWTAWVFDYAIH